jgi:hypothetical protein
MRHVTDIGRAFFLPMAVSRIGRCSIVTLFWGGRSSCKQSFLAKHGVFNRHFQTSIPENQWLRRYGHLLSVGWI